MAMPNDPLPPVVDLRGDLDPVTIAILERIAAGDEPVKVIAIWDADELTKIQRYLRG